MILSGCSWKWVGFWVRLGMLMEWRHKDWEAPAAWIQTRSAVVAFSSQPFLRESFSARPSCSSHLRPICATAPLDGFLFTECVFPNNPSCRRRRAAQNIYIHIDRIESRAAARRLPPVPRFFLRTRARSQTRKWFQRLHFAVCFDFYFQARLVFFSRKNDRLSGSCRRCWA